VENVLWDKGVLDNEEEYWIMKKGIVWKGNGGISGGKFIIYINFTSST